jgi:N-acetylglucosaminyldiphosphoundecaprenol N-acetyl-beta-D-mannosaminyltransferase
MARADTASAAEQPLDSSPPRRLRLAQLDFDQLTEAEVVGHVVTQSESGRGGWIATPNIDICRKCGRDELTRAIIGTATLVVPDGMPLMWAARLRGEPLPERVTGSGLIFSLSEAAARHGRSIYLLGGAPGVPDRAGCELTRRFPGLKVAGAAAPPVGFDQTGAGLAAVRAQLLEAAPDIVYVGLGFPKQEQVIAQLLATSPAAWFLACGAAIDFAAGERQRAPRWLQRAGLEWLFRLVMEPRRLFRRYLVDDAPFAAALLASSAAKRLRGRPAGRRTWRRIA